MSLYVIEIEIEAKAVALELDQLRLAAKMALAHLGVGQGAQLTIMLTDDHTLRRLNRVHMGYNEPTDVLSFPMDTPIPGVGTYLGDIAISIQTARRQAQRIGHSLTAELQTLIVHAILHLLGYDHESPEREAEMWAVKSSILAELASDVIIPTNFSAR